ncbi:Succinate dehydrogenase assembly factor 2, mitochondrial [Caenorhabditis elegans]|uniref:Succinate dehydrogenase assembly factor 2, mitochondrial n=1 Tax=Caenorhabditis elegans TaxID=6239 RepID=SDHF2_CAEEL|nr:Succinate dehydrogenase assembly factor 2, mitochondrial [Caenorhabditis elegans]Q9NA72.1 RecName: Full=Succinate dehydrogenase assembly factor 2, mitochondrial; Short=SDH assembly factor 2; Short=SDHAF2 [Caenorhabditis elegans]CAB55034.1 Succinate dehydrogenase assembly factor 2, mitochondrial [Caenorhabditis elegans]|eukprot:NP_496607.1 Succinate dehydrogenase assembly factor 2, mitochondrial [Caenorhabditis elegans]
MTSRILQRFFTVSTSLRSLTRAEVPGEKIDAKRARLLYQSKKRGILENDILLGDFAEQNLKKMSEPELKAYDKLINGEHMEWDLFYYLSNKKSPPEDVESCQVYQKVKKFVDDKRVPKS